MPRHFHPEQIKPTLVFIVVGFLSAAMPWASIVSASPLLINLFANDDLDGEGVQTFSLDAIVYRSGSSPHSITTPTGQKFDLWQFSAPNDLGTFATLEDLIETLTGEWTYETTLPTDPLLSEVYKFTVSSFGPDELTVQRPTILQPANGAIVRGPFDFEWDPPSTNYTNGAEGVSVERTLVRPGLLHNVPTTIGGQTGSIHFSTRKSHPLNSYISDIVQPTNAQFDLDAGLNFQRGIRTRVSVRPIPEPGTFLLCLLSVAGLALMRRQRSR